MQVRVSDDGNLAIPPAIRKELGIEPGSVLDVSANQGVLQALVVSPRLVASSKADVGRLARLKSHPDAIVSDADDLDKAIVWDAVLFPLPPGQIRLERICTRPQGIGQDSPT